MRTQHRGPLFACLVLTLGCGLFLGNTLRIQGIIDVITATERYASYAAVAVPIRLDLDLRGQGDASGPAVPAPAVRPVPVSRRQAPRAIVTNPTLQRTAARPTVRAAGPGGADAPTATRGTSVATASRTARVARPAAPVRQGGSKAQQRAEQKAHKKAEKRTRPTDRGTTTRARRTAPAPTRVVSRGQAKHQDRAGGSTKHAGGHGRSKSHGSTKSHGKARSHGSTKGHSKARSHGSTKSHGRRR